MVIWSLMSDIFLECPIKGMRRLPTNLYLITRSFFCTLGLPWNTNLIGLSALVTTKTSNNFQHLRVVTHCQVLYNVVSLVGALSPQLTYCLPVVRSTQYNYVLAFHTVLHQFEPGLCTLCLLLGVPATYLRVYLLTLILNQNSTLSS